jgi:hypothetical protein
VYLLHKFLSEARLDDIRRDAERAALRGRVPRRRAASVPVEFAVTIRYASGDDAVALERLAALDCRPVPAPPVLVVEVEDQLSAALSLSDGATIADPFRPTAGLLQLLVTRAVQLRRSGRARGRRRRGGRRTAQVTTARP